MIWQLCYVIFNICYYVGSIGTYRMTCVLLLHTNYIQQY